MKIFFLELETDEDDDLESKQHELEKQKYIKSSEGSEPELLASKSRQKRQMDQYEYTPTKTRCPLLLVADYRFFQEMGASNTKTTINYLVLIFLCTNNLLEYNARLYFIFILFDLD